MKRALSNIPFLVLVAVFIVIVSIWADHGQSQWAWFNRSGSVVTLIGAILCYRSIVRLGSGGVGGASPSMIMAKVISVDDSGPIQRMSIGVDEETRKSIRQANIDSKAGVIGAVLTIVGTLIWGYGDLLGRVL